MKKIKLINNDNIRMNFYFAFKFLINIILIKVKNNRGMKIEVVTLTFSEVPNIKKKLFI